MSNAYTPPPRKLKAHHLGIVIDEDLLERLRRHRDLLDEGRGVELTTTSAAVRYLLVWAMDRIERGVP